MTGRSRAPVRVRVTRVSAGTRGGGEVGWSCTPPCLPCLRAPARTRASIPPQNPRVPPSAHGTAPRGVYAGAEDPGGAARAAPAGPRGKARSRSLTPRVFATPCQRCLPNRFSQTMPFRRWQPHGRGPAKRIGHPGTSWLFPGGAGGHPAAPESNCAPGSRSPPTPP